MTVYAGIGSRRTPPDVLGLMERLARVLARQGWLLRSGHAPGADQAFERGAGARAQVFLPWSSFEAETPIAAAAVYTEPSEQAYAIAEQNHPAWERCSHGARALHARNVHQVLGPNIEERISMVVCWTPDGSLNGRGPDTGGTGQALRIAASYLDINVVNMQRDQHLSWVIDYLERHEND